MIAALRGTLIEKNGDTLVVDVNGVGYEVIVSGEALSALEGEGKEVSLVVHTDVKENAISLFGFRNGLEKQVFLLVKKVKGVGSRLALNIISAIGAEGLLTSIGHSDVTSLKRVPGVGKKTAERLIVELRDMVGDFATALPVSLSADIEKISIAPIVGENQQKLGQAGMDAVLALERLGFPEQRAFRAVALAIEQGAAKGESDAGEIVRMALAHL